MEAMLAEYLPIFIFIGIAVAMAAAALSASWLVGPQNPDPATVSAYEGGFAPFADKANVQIVRQMQDGTEETYRFDYEAYIEGKAPGSNIVLRNGDTIIVSE